MRKIMIITVFVLVVAGIISAEEATYKPTVLEDWAKQASVIEVFFLYPGVSSGLRYETKIDDTISAGGSVIYGFVDDAQSYGIRLECYFYPQSHGLNAWFVGPFAGSYNLNSATPGAVFFSLGAQGGYRWIFDCITLAPRAMIQYGLDYEGEKKIIKGAGGFIYAVGVSAGYAF